MQQEPLTTQQPPKVRPTPQRASRIQQKFSLWHKNTFSVCGNGSFTIIEARAVQATSRIETRVAVYRRNKKKSFSGKAEKSLKRSIAELCRRGKSLAELSDARVDVYAERKLGQTVESSDFKATRSDNTEKMKNR